VLASPNEILRVAGLDAGVSAPELLMGDHRNLVWTAREIATGKVLVIKTSRDLRTKGMIAREAIALRAMEGWPHVPTLRAAGALPGDRPFLVTDALDGAPFAAALHRATGGPPGELMRRLADWLCDFSRRDVPPALACEAGASSGSWAADYRPRGAPPVVVGLVHGSFDPGNVLVKGHGPDLRLAGILDFEASRPGSALIDIASMAVRLVIGGRADLCQLWLAAAAEAWRSTSLPSEVLPYSLAQNERRRQAARADPRVAVATPTLLAAGHRL
jgi:aminoglycoside phosphotransferase (APT) family kinase protein